MPQGPAAAPGGAAARVAKVVGYAVLRGVWISTMVLTPLFGFWLASSLAAYKNASQWLALLGGLALFPLLPVGWEAFAAWRRTKQKAPKKQILTRIDRLVLRTLAINGVFLVVMLWAAKATAFRALAVRGDWMVDDCDNAVCTNVRGFLLGIADKLDSHKAADDDGGRYGSSDSAPDPSKVKHRDDTPSKVTGTEPPKTAAGWPLDDTPDPKVVDMPESATASITSVGAYLKEQFPDKKQRVKAIHDFVALRLEYDYDTLKLIERNDYMNVPSQEAEPVFARKKGVCAGYAKLMSAIGSAANIELKYITGYIRDSVRRVAPGSDDQVKASLQGYRHAWNAVLIDDEWFLIDATWDDPTGAETPVRSTYLFTPPKLFAYDHLPEDPAWQLVMSPISPGDFARLPIMSPEIGRLGLTLESPTRSQVSVSGTLEIVLDNPYGAEVLAQPKNRSGECRVAAAGGKTTATCSLPDGEHEVRLFAGPRGSRSYEYIGSILANSR